MALIDFFPMSPRIFTDERLYNLDTEYFKMFCYCYFGTHSAAYGKIGIHRVGRGELATGANISIKKTEEILSFFDKTIPELLCYSSKTHMIFLPSKLKYLIRAGYLKDRYIFAEIHRDFNKYGSRAIEYFDKFVDLYEEDIKNSFNLISKKDNNYPAFLKTYEKLFYKKKSKEKESLINLSFLKTSEEALICF